MPLPSTLPGNVPLGTARNCCGHSALCGQKVPGGGALVVGAKPLVSLPRGRWEQFDKKYLSQLLMRKSAYRLRDEIWDVYYKLNIRDAISFVDQVGTCSGGCVAGWPRQELAGLGWGSPSTYPLARQWAPSLLSRCQRCPPTSQGGHVLSAAKMALPSMPSRTSMSESSVTNLL